MHKDYFQGILQLRQTTKVVNDFVKEETKRDGKAKISKTKKVRNGIDMYFTSNNYLQSLGKKLQKKFSGELKISAKLHTRSKDGRDLYRVNVLFKPYFIKVGQIVVVKGEKVKINRIGQKIFGKIEKTGKRCSFSFSDLN